MILPILKIHEVLTQQACSSSTLYRNIQSGLCTKPVKLGKRAVGWPGHEINALNAARIAGFSDDEIRKLTIELHTKRKALLVDIIGGVK